MWQAFIHFLSAPAAPYIFCGLIALVFAYGLIDGWMRLSATRVAVSRGLAILHAVPSRSAFYEQFEALADQFAAQPLFAAAWSEFSKIVIVDGDRQLVRITRRPHEFFSERSLLAPRINLRLYAALPSYLVSLGLFFTFIGLVAAIAIAAQGLKAADVNTTQAALVQLLDVASLKFLTSVAGISLSIILSFVQKAWLNRVSMLIHQFCDAVEARTQLVTTEQLLHQWIIAQETTTRSFSHLAEDIASEVRLQMKANA